MNTYTVIQIGTIHTPFSKPTGMPIQASGAYDSKGYIDIDPRYAEGLSDLTGFERIILLYVFHKCEGYSLQVTPYLDTKNRGLFATRAPQRPNRIGLSVVRLKNIEGNRLNILDADVLDGTPLLDIKPYVPKFDSFPCSRAGWLEEKQKDAQEKKADGRFHS